MTPVFVLTFSDVVGIVLCGLLLLMLIPVLVLDWWKRRKKP